MEAVDLLDSLGVKRFKIGSGEVENFLMLEHIAKTGKDIWLSSGMSSEIEIKETLDLLVPYKNQVSLFQCTTEYPTQPNSWGLNVISEWKNRFKIPIGFSDHSGDIYACLSAAVLGAELLEFHVVFDKQMFGPDAKASLDLKQTSHLCEGLKQVQVALNNHVDKNQVENFKLNKVLFGKSLAARIEIPQGTEIAVEYLESKKPGNCGVAARDYKSIIGKKVIKNIPKGAFLTSKDFI
jgi:N-acetylneuraminate synthase